MNKKISAFARDTEQKILIRYALIICSLLLIIPPVFLAAYATWYEAVAAAVIFVVVAITFKFLSIISAYNLISYLLPLVWLVVNAYCLFRHPNYTFTGHMLLLLMALIVPFFHRKLFIALYVLIAGTILVFSVFYRNGKLTATPVNVGEAVFFVYILLGGSFLIYRYRRFYDKWIDLLKKEKKQLEARGLELETDQSEKKINNNLTRSKK